MRQRASLLAALGHGDENARKGKIQARAKSAATRCTAMKTLIALSARTRLMSLELSNDIENISLGASDGVFQ